MSRAEYMRQYRARQKAMVVDDNTEGFYLARIAELEEEVRTLKAELAKLEASAHAAAGDWIAEPPSLVTADGTQGMRRGVSVGLTRSTPGAADTA